LGREKKTKIEVIKNLSKKGDIIVNSR